MEFVKHVTHRAHHLGDAIGVEVRGGFVQQQYARSHRQRARQGEPLHLPATQVGDRTVQLQAFQTDRGERVVHAPPDFVTFHIEVLRSEGDIVAEPLEHGLRVRILQDESHTSSRLMHGNAVHQYASFGGTTFGVDHGDRAVFRGFLTLREFVGAQQTGSAFENGGFADAGRTQEQHALPGFDIEIQAAHAEMFA